MISARYILERLEEVRVRLEERKLQFDLLCSTQPLTDQLIIDTGAAHGAYAAVETICENVKRAIEADEMGIPPDDPESRLM